MPTTKLSPVHKEGDRVTKLRELRISHGYTQAELAAILEISLRTYQRIEYGEQKPNVHVVIRLQGLFQKDIREIIEKMTGNGGQNTKT